MASNLRAIASNLRAIASNLRAMASNLRAMASNLRAMASNLRAISSDLRAMASNLKHFWPHIVAIQANSGAFAALRMAPLFAGVTQLAAETCLLVLSDNLWLRSSAPTRPSRHFVATALYAPGARPPLAATWAVHSQSYTTSSLSDCLLGRFCLRRSIPALPGPPGLCHYGNPSRPRGLCCWFAQRPRRGIGIKRIIEPKKKVFVVR